MQLRFFKIDFKTKKGYDSFIEEMIVRRELAENYCFYNKNYDNIQGFPDWARKTLKDVSRINNRQVVFIIFVFFFDGNKIA